MKRFCLLFLILLSSCGANTIKKDIYEYEDVIAYQISYKDVFKQKEETYYIYYYQVDCYYCHGIKSKMIYFALNSEIKVYFVEIEKDYGFISKNKEDTIGATDYLKAFAKMTPQLSLVTNGTVVETYLGQEEILNICLQVITL